MSLSSNERNISTFRPSGQTSDENGQRLDIFLFRTRLIKTRALAARTIRMGRVRIERYGKTDRVRKAHAKVRKGDILTFMREKSLIHIEVNDLPYRRGPAPEAQACYSACGADNSQEIENHTLRRA